MLCDEFSDARYVAMCIHSCRICKVVGGDFKCACFGCLYLFCFIGWFHFKVGGNVVFLYCVAGRAVTGWWSIGRPTNERSPPEAVDGSRDRARAGVLGASSCGRESCWDPGAGQTRCAAGSPDWGFTRYLLLVLSLDLLPFITFSFTIRVCTGLGR